jgi:hypothetical protein
MTSKVIEGHKGSVSLREFKKILPNTFIYELILIKICMYTNIMNMQIFHFNKYYLEVH